MATEPTPGETVPADAVVEALEGYQRATLDLYERHADDPESCVMDLIRLHLAWTEEDLDRARMVARHRNAVAAGPAGERLNRSNLRLFEATREWLARQTDSGRLPPLSFNVMHALVFAPSQELAKLWLSDRLKKPPTAYAERMGRAAWAGLLAAGDGPGEKAPG